MHTSKPAVEALSNQQPDRDLLPWQWLLLLLGIGFLSARYPAAAGTAAAIGILLNRGHSRGKLSILLLAGVGLAGWAASWATTPAQVSELPDWMRARKKVAFTAEIERTRAKPQNRLQITLDRVRIQAGQSRQELLPAKVVWTWQDPTERPAPGQTVQGALRIKPVRGFANPGTWDTRFYWALRGVAYRAFSKGPLEAMELHGQAGTLWQLRQALREAVLRSTSPGAGQGLLLALIMGDRSQLSYDTLDLVRRASLAHSLALSGLHLGFIVSFGWGLAWLVGWFRPQTFLGVPRQKLTLVLGVPLVLAYLWLGQARPSLIRASLMFFFWGLLLLRGRRTVLLDGLLFALAVILLFSPFALYDLGLQLSVVAVAGIVLLWPKAWSWYQSMGMPSTLKKILAPAFALLAVSAVANAILLPITAWSFGQISPHLVLNLVWLPVLGWLVLPLGLLGLILSLLPGLEVMAGCLFSAAAGLLDWLVAMLETLNRQGLLEVLVPLRPRWPELLGYWLILGLAATCWRVPRRAPAWILCLALIMLALPRAAGIFAQGGQIGLRLLDVGQGQAALITTPQNKRLLIDGGGSWNPDFDLGRFAVSPALTWGKPPRLDMVVLSHGDFDHLRGLFYLLEHFEVGSFAFNGYWPTGRDGKRLRRILEERDIPYQTLSAGERIPLGPKVSLEVLHPEAGRLFSENNNRSLTLRLVAQGRGLALLPGDLENAGIERLLDSGAELQSQVLVIPHHGSRSSLSPELYDRVQPECALVSCGFLNVFRFPHDSVLDELQDREIPLWSTSRHGAIMVEWNRDGEGRRVIPYRRPES